jgi:type II secretory ATPase GspE/PulE/Tfp pilus assembly ATPase PilB-like protein
MELPKTVAPALVSRIKILSSLKIDEHRIPQDGQFSVLVDGKEIDLRIAISPVYWGEQVVIRLLDKKSVSMDIESMGMTGHALRDVLHAIKQPNGMILTSGPTGSGKSTTLYALIQKIKSEEINIVTLEDPVEYKIDGINQIQVNVDAGLTFASGLRSILRQDPDVVMVGEIRDGDTAKTAIQASITGHLVLSSFHANSTSAAFARMIDLIGVNPIFASSIRLIIAQRLVRKLADSKKPRPATESEASYIREALKSASEEQLSGINLDNITLYDPVVTEEHPFGYDGRNVIMEQLIVDESIQGFIRGDVADINTTEIEKAAKKNGMLTLEQKGLLAVLHGDTTLSEVSRVI